jgi:hypothetical protein
MAAVVPVMVVPAILLAVNPVVVPVMPMAIGIYNPPRCRFYHDHTWWRRRRMVVPVPMPVAIIIARVVGTIGTG